MQYWISSYSKQTIKDIDLICYDRIFSVESVPTCARLGSFLYHTSGRWETSEHNTLGALLERHFHAIRAVFKDLYVVSKFHCFKF